MAFRKSQLVNSIMLRTHDLCGNHQLLASLVSILQRFLQHKLSVTSGVGTITYTQATYRVLSVTQCSKNKYGGSTHFYSGQAHFRNATKFLKPWKCGAGLNDYSHTSFNIVKKSKVIQRVIAFAWVFRSDRTSVLGQKKNSFASIQGTCTLEVQKTLWHSIENVGKVVHVRDEN